MRLHSIIPERGFYGSHTHAMNEQKNVNKAKVETPLYGIVEFAKPAQLRKVEKYGRVSCPAIVCHVPILGTGLAVETAIWAERKETKDGIEVEFAASLPRGIKPFGDGADDARENFIAHVELSAVKWAGYDSATDAALALLTGTKIKGKVEPRPRLVKRPETGNRPAA
jgi:hypothetical protein